MCMIFPTWSGKKLSTPDHAIQALQTKLSSSAFRGARSARRKANVVHCHVPESDFRDEHWAQVRSRIALSRRIVRLHVGPYSPQDFPE